MGQTQLYFPKTPMITLFYDLLKKLSLVKVTATILSCVSERPFESLIIPFLPGPMKILVFGIVVKRARR